MGTLRDLFSIYQGLELPKEETKPIPPLFRRSDFINQYIDSKIAEQKEEEEEEEILEEPIVEKETSRYSRMKDYASNKNPLNTVMNFFINKGLTAAQAAGFAGNFLAESELSPTAINQSEKKKGYKGYGRGIAQWSNDRVKQFKQYIGKNVEDSSLEEQLEFVWHEVQQRPELLRQLQAATNSSAAADIVYRGYENGSQTGLATPEQLIQSYGESWQALGLRRYDFDTELLARQNRALYALENYQI